MARRPVVCAVLLCCAVGFTGRAAASAPAPPGPSLKQVEADELQRAQDRSQASAEAADARQEIAQLQAELNELDAAEKSGETSVSGKRLRLAALTAREQSLETDLGDAQNRLARLLGALELFRRDPPPALFVDPKNVRDAVRAAILIRAITPELEQQAETLKAQLESLRRVKRAVDTASEDIFTSESDLAEQRAKIEALIAAKSALEGQDAADAQSAGRDVESLAGRAAALRDLSRGLDVVLPPIGVMEPPDPDHAGPGGKPETFTAPAPGAPARRFGDQEPDGEKSQGWTWRTTRGASVAAPAPGLVEYAGPLKAWNVVLILRLGGGYHLVLAGLDAATVAPGQMVNEGQPVGRMASADGAAAELHLEVRRDGSAVDPGRWLKTSASQPARH